jgi:hypothetical protein
MPHEFIARNGLLGLANSTISGSLAVSQSVTAQSFTGSLSGSATTATSASYALTASYADNVPLTASYALVANTASYAISASNAATASSADNLTVRGTLTAQTIVVQTITSSVVEVTGSTQFGSTTANTHEFTGSVTVSGSLQVNGTTATLGTGTINTVPKFTAASTIGDSNITDSGTLITLGSNTTISSGGLGIGTSTLTGYSLRIAKNITGSTTSYGIRQDGIVQSDVTSDVIGFRNDSNTAASAFTLTNYTHFWARQGTIGAGSAITNQYGYRVDSNMTGATNNYAFNGSIASGTNRWNIYMDGTANNYLAGALGIGTTNLTGYGLRVSKNITGATSAYGIFQNGTVQSDVTTLAIGIWNTLNTVASVFTLPAYTHINISQGTIGAGSSVTNQYGLFIDSSLTGATNNYGFYGNIVSGTGRWNLYMNGTANNYLRGNLGIGSGKTVPSVALDVSGSALITGSLNVTAGITGSLSGSALTATSASYALTASYADNVPLTSSYALVANTASYAISASNAATASSADNLTVRGTLTAQTIVVQTITSSVAEITGSTQFGSTTANTHEFTGSVTISGSITANGDFTATNPTPAPFISSTDGRKITSAGNIWNNSFGSQIMRGGIQVLEYHSNSNPTISKLSFQVGTDNATAIEQMYVTSNGLFGINGGANFNAGSGSYFNDITLTQTSASTNSTSKSSNRLVLKGTAWNSSQGSAPNIGYLQMNTVANNASPTVDKLSFSVGSANNANYNNVVGNATERFAIRTDGIFSYFNSAGAEFLTIGGSNGLYVSGSSSFTGSLIQSGSLISYGPNTFVGNTIVTGSVTSTNGFTGSLSGSASTATSASYALTASYAANVPLTSSYALNANTASYALFALSVPGMSTGSSYAAFTQASPSTTWTFNHNLGYLYPVITVYDADSNQIIPSQVSASSANQLQIIFSSARTGYATAVIGSATPTPSTVNVYTAVGANTLVGTVTGSYNSAFFNYSAVSASNARAGQIMTIWTGSAISFSETTTNDIGNTSGVTFTASLSGNTIALTAGTTSANWNIKLTSAYL